jgi:catechol 2,3-dioxygenase-like lactoylglutathione lyase family enzyme
MNGFSAQGLDHVMILARDLDAATEGWRRLGFTVSARGVHSAHLGTANHTIMLQGDYVELIGVLTETPTNLVTRAFLDRRGDGMDRVAMRTRDAYADAAALRAAGMPVLGPFDFSRQVDLGSGASGEARFSVFHWPLEQAPADLRLRACQHHTPDYVWLPDLQRHANTARHIQRLELVAADPSAATAHMARLIGTEAGRDHEGHCVVPSGAGRADFMFIDAAQLARRYPRVTRPSAPEGVAVLALAVTDIDAAGRAVGPAGQRNDNGIVVPPDRANGIILVLEQA